MRVGVVILPELRAAALRTIWRRAEQLGFAHAWTYDHLAWRSLRDAPWFAAVPTLAAAALATRRLRLGILVASPNFRHPVPFARELITLDDLSGGRFTLGIGAGGEGWDATILGQAPWSTRERADRFAEFVCLTDQLLRQPATSYSGRFYSANEARCVPGCVQLPRIPFAIAATGRRGMRLAARYGQLWVTTGDRTHPARPTQRAARSWYASRSSAWRRPARRSGAIPPRSNAWCSAAHCWTPGSAPSKRSATQSATMPRPGSPTSSSTGRDPVSLMPAIPRPSSASSRRCDRPRSYP